MTPENQQTTFFTVNVIGALVVGLIIGALVGAYFANNRHNTALQNGTKTDDHSMTDTSSSTDAIKDSHKGEVMDMSNNPIAGNVSANVDNKNAGNTVVLSSITLDKSYWVAVRDSSTEVANPYILGARRVQAGTTNNLVIALSRATMKDKNYDIVLYRDNGGMFDYDTKNLVNINNSAVLVSFKAE